ncbi:MAG: hypothetical protein IPH62_09825 [Ignavibacteriae bacterium]|nr:hypothetical protein [Ignavibacteriota bacterium]
MKLNLIIKVTLIFLAFQLSLVAQKKFEHHINRLALEVSENGASLYRDNTILYPTWPYDTRYYNFSSRKMYIESWGVWMGAKNFMGVGDTIAKDAFVACGNMYLDINNIVPLSLQKRIRYPYPTVRIDDGSGRLKVESFDDVNLVTSLICDEQIESVWTTSLGITVQLKTYAYAVEGHKNYIIYDYKFLNTGNVDSDDLTKELNKQLNDVYFGISFSTDIKPRFGGTEMDDNYEYFGSTYDDWVKGDKTADSTRVLIAWDGDHVDTENYDPDPITQEPRVPGYYGLGILHVDKQAIDDLESGSSDDPSQPKNVTDASGLESSPSTQIQKLSQGGNENFASYGAGNFLMSFGPYNIPVNEDVRIVLVQVIDGISREKAEDLGMKLLNGNITKEEYNSEVSTGRDSLFKSLNGAKIAFKRKYNIPDPLPSPDSIYVATGIGNIKINWSKSAESAIDPDSKKADFAGYRLYRAAISPENKWEKILEVGGNTGLPIVHSYIDSNVIMGFDYYYAVTAFDDGLNNYLKPGQPLESSKLTSTAYVGTSAAMEPQASHNSFKKNLRVVPNPFNIRSVNYGDPNNPSDLENNKLLFVGLPGICKIRIFTVAGDLVKTIYHTSGLGSEEWDQVTDSNQYIVSGIYIAHVESELGDEIIKFVVIR